MQKMCACGLSQKAPGKQRCQECLEATWDAARREQAADERLAMVPPALRRARVPEAEWPPGRRWCSGCQSFVRLKDCGKGASRCRTCTGRVAHAGHLERTYTIHGRPFTADDYALMYRKQGGRCYACGRKSETKRLAVDHDHVTGEVRCLLCPDIDWGCNRGILAKIKNVEHARKFVEILEDPPAAHWIPE
jgi:recombination endonuclease VII